MNNLKISREDLVRLRLAEFTVSHTDMIVRPEHRKEFFQTVTDISEKIRGEKGCVSFRVYEEKGNENSLILVGEWDSEAYLHLHTQGENHAILHGSLLVLSIKSRIGHRLLGVTED